MLRTFNNIVQQSFFKFWFKGLRIGSVFKWCVLLACFCSCLFFDWLIDWFGFIIIFLIKGPFWIHGFWLQAPLSRLKPSSVCTYAKQNNRRAQASLSEIWTRSRGFEKGHRLNYWLWLWLHRLKRLILKCGWWSKLY